MGQPRSVAWNDVDRGDALRAELRHFRRRSGCGPGRRRDRSSRLEDEKLLRSLAPSPHAESDVGDHGIDRQARYQPIRIAATGDRRNVEPEMAKGPGPLGGFLETPSWSPRR